MKRNIRVSIPYGGNIDLLRDCIKSLVEQVPEYSIHSRCIYILNDTMEPIDWNILGKEYLTYCQEEIPPVWLVHSQMLNWILELAKDDRQDWAIGFHTDAYLLPGGFKNLMDGIEKAENERDDIALVDTGAFMLLYGINMKFVRESKWKWDPQLFPMYFEDNHFHAVIQSYGYEVLKTVPYNASAFHHGSHMIKENPLWERRNQITFDRSKEIYKEIWGGYPGKETRLWDSTANGTRET